jgi:hypothetical protein
LRTGTARFRCHDGGMPVLDEFDIAAAEARRGWFLAS